jgi:hypothetical protein
MTFSQALSTLQAGQVIPYSSVDGAPTGRGSMMILAIGPDRVSIQTQNGTHRRITEKDWNTVENNLPQLLQSGSHRQSMRESRNVTYVLSIRAHTAQCVVAFNQELNQR